MGGLPYPESMQVTPTHTAEASGIEAWACCYAPICCNNREDKPATQLQTDLNTFTPITVDSSATARRQTSLFGWQMGSQDA